MKGNIVLAIAGGAIGAVLGAAIWTMVTVYTGYQIGYMAIGVGALIGFLIRLMGRGHTTAYSMIGVGFAILGCVAGNVLSGIGFVAKENGLGFLNTYLHFNYAASYDVLVAMFSPIDILFYAIAIRAAYTYSKIRDPQLPVETSQAESFLRER
ncbi:hypothetical protein JIN85_00915 [Luteolibacter pohnpeiensis]|uniref:Uncharacterized protein n=1 Tax=Luteolibacter pohnpeiensis TaxID=454153 RepID=A0A934S249_9BACT|nr:hypothetical protein [Luteolibacter pohnpeiensis]MBK1880952.1 hypothetical protein [Luteolibacter pohnpeiensis]